LEDPDDVALGSGYPAAAGRAVDARGMLQAATDLVEREGLGRDQFEFQMLYGIRRDLQQQLVQAGYRVRIYVPYGREWYPYFMRRLAERPANVMFLLRSVAREGRRRPS